MAGPPVQVDDPRLLACVEDGPPDIGTLWEFCMYFEFDRAATAAGVADWLGAVDGRRILDSACGSGFPSLELVAMGYDVTCADGSDMMLRHFRRNARMLGLAVEPVAAQWEDMPDRFGGQFDVVLNRGGGNYKYVGAWETERLPSRDAMQDAIRQWVACLRPGGALYIDFAPESVLEHQQPEITVHPTLHIGGHVVDITEQIAVDLDLDVRYWRSELRVDQTRYEFQRRSHCLKRNEFQAMLAGCGLVDIQLISVKGEHYDVYSATRSQEGGHP